MNVTTCYELLIAHAVVARQRLADADPRNRGVSLEEAVIAAGLLAAALALVAIIVAAINSHSAEIK